MKISIYPGTFDPITNGHLDIIERAIHLFDKVVVSVAINSNKNNTLFSDNDRIDFIRTSVSDMPSVEVDSFAGLMVEHAEKHSAQAAIRGLRVLSDFEFEFRMALMNRSLNKDVSTVFLMPHPRYTHISSSIVREVASHGGDVSTYVPIHVDKALKSKYNE